MTAKVLRVLLVDDESDIVSVLKRGLELKGFEVDGFTDPQKALEKFRPNYYDVLVTDIRMPVMNGFQLCRKVQEKDPKVRVVFLSAFDIYAEEANMMFPTLRSKSFVKKPIGYDQLAKMLMKH